MHSTQQVMQLGEFIRELDLAVDEVSFCDPDVVACEPRPLCGQIAFSRALLTLTNADDPDCTVVAGYVDMVLINPKQPDLDDAISLALDELDYPEAAKFYTRLFERGALPAKVTRKLGPGKLDGLAVLLGVFVDPCFRGHRLGAWLLAHVLPPTEPGVRFAILGHLDSAMLRGRGVAGSDDALGELSAYWQRETQLRLVGEGLLGVINTPGSVAAALEKAHDRNDNYIKLAPASLRTRLAEDDDTLFPLYDGRADEPTPAPAGHFLALAAEAVDVAEAAVQYVHDDVDAQVATVLSFSTCTGAAGDSAELFGRVAEYLDAHPELLVTATNWRSQPCSDAGQHLILDITVQATET